MSKEIKTLISELNDEELLEKVKKDLKTRPPLDIIEDLKDGLSIVGDLFEKGDYFLSDLIFAADIFHRANELIEPHIMKGAKEVKGKVVIGTVEGDFHDIGKNIIISLLRSNGYLVEDLGKDVGAEKFLEAVQKNQPDILGMSGLLTASYEPMKKTIELVKREYKDELIIIVGGAPINERWVKEVGADYGTNNAAVGIKLINQALQKTLP
ncbi:MAG: cobalamin B12-binding domain-containing protein [Candidatus Helarchaeota archaeon]|nr:cobalamin B12-binding domain-containing protein [Candidatus Helarchaeota archaeon]